MFCRCYAPICDWNKTIHFDNLNLWNKFLILFKHCHCGLEKNYVLINVCFWKMWSLTSLCVYYVISHIILSVLIMWPLTSPCLCLLCDLSHHFVFIIWPLTSPCLCLLCDLSHHFVGVYYVTSHITLFVFIMWPLTSPCLCLLCDLSHHFVCVFYQTRQYEEHKFLYVFRNVFSTS